MADRMSRDEVIAFRLASHHLLEPANDLPVAAGACGIQDSPPGAALLALHARVRGVTRELLAGAVSGRTLLRTWCMRGAPFYVPTSDAAVFTAGVLPPSDDGIREFLPGLVPALEALDMSASEAVDLTREGVRHALSGRRLPINDLGAEVAERVAGRLLEAQRATWTAVGPYAPGQPLGEAVVHFCLRILTLQGVVCFAPREGNKAPFVLVDEWLGHPLSDVHPAQARAELLRRYLHCYGPSTPGQFAAWAGIRHPEAWWSLISDELTPVAFEGVSWLLSADRDAVRPEVLPQGVRLLPPGDPYLQLRDRATILDRRQHGRVWRASGAPGAVLADGLIVGTWRAHKRGRTLAISCTFFGPSPDPAALHEQAVQVAALRGAASVEVHVAE